MTDIHRPERVQCFLCSTRLLVEELRRHRLNRPLTAALPAVYSLPLVVEVTRVYGTPKIPACLLLPDRLLILRGGL